MLLKQITWMLHKSRYIIPELWLRARIKKIGKGTVFTGRVKVNHPQKLEVGSECSINGGAHLQCKGGMKIGNNCHIAPNLVVYTFNHEYESDWLPYSRKSIVKPVVIEDNVWIGANVKIAPGVTSERVQSSQWELS